MITNQEEELRRLNKVLEKKVLDLTLALESINKDLESFSYSVSHDLRAPLRAVNGYARILEEDYKKVLDEEGQRLLGVVQANAEKMGVLIDDLLAFSRLGRKEIQRTHLDMEQLVNGTILELNKIHPLKAEINIGRLHSVQADYLLMNQVFISLISNGIKFSSKKEKPVITISSEEKDNEVIFSVKDNGTGFDMRYYDKLFQVFQRLHSNEDFEGTGVGLAITKRIVNKHGGKVWAESKQGEGSVFYFSLPH